MARPPKYKTEEELREKSLGYFKYLENGIETNEVLGIKIDDTPTKTGLRLWLDIDKSTYSDYKKKFPNPIKWAEDIIEDCWVQNLRNNNVAGTIFYLKNAFKDEYRDRYDTDITSGGDKIIPILGNVSKNDSNAKDNKAQETN